MLEEKLEELKTYSHEMVRDSSKFDPDVLINISNRLISAAYELNQSYKKYKSARPLPWWFALYVKKSPNSSYLVVN